MMGKGIWFTEINHHGAIVIYGDIGIRQYYFYTEKKARKLYLEECKKEDMVREAVTV